MARSEKVFEQWTRGDENNAIVGPFVKHFHGRFDVYVKRTVSAYNLDAVHVRLVSVGGGAFGEDSRRVGTFTLARDHENDNGGTPCYRVAELHVKSGDIMRRAYYGYGSTVCAILRAWASGNLRQLTIAGTREWLAAIRGIDAGMTSRQYNHDRGLGVGLLATLPAIDTVRQETFAELVARIDTVRPQ